MKKTIICLLLAALAALALIFISCSDGESSGKNKNGGNDKTLEQLAEVSAEAVKVKVNEITESGDGRGYADVTITLPDYTELFLDIMNKPDIASALSSELKKDKYDELKFDRTVPVTFDERGKETVHSEDEVKKLIEAELIKALNAVYEEEYR